MFIGEMDYNDLVFGHWLGYVIFVLFAFLLIIVLMNILNGEFFSFLLLSASFVGPFVKMWSIASLGFFAILYSVVL